MSRINIILVGLAVVQVIILLVMRFTGGNDTGGDWQTEALLPFSAEAVAQVEITDGSDDETILLAKTDSGWVLGSADDYPLRENVVITAHVEGQPHLTGSALLDKLGRAEVTRPVIVKADNHPQVKVADGDFTRRLRFRDADGKELGVLYVGESASGSRQTYLRRSGEDVVFADRELSVWDMRSDATSWVQTSYLSLATPSITALDVTIHGDAPIELKLEKREIEVPATEEGKEPTKESSWYLVGEEKPLDKTKVETLLGKICSVNLKDVSGKAPPAAGRFDSPLATYVLKQGDTETTVVIGAHDEADSSCHLKSSASELHVKAASWSIKPTVEVTAESLRPEED